MDNYNNNRMRSSSTHYQKPIRCFIRSFSEHPYSRFAPNNDHHHNEATPFSSSRSSSSKMERFWRKMIRKLRGEKKAFGSGRHSNPVIVPYNSYTYAMNFDETGSTAGEPENFPRSFSARFAGAASSSSRMFMKRIQSVR